MAIPRGRKLMRRLMIAGIILVLLQSLSCVKKIKPAPKGLVQIEPYTTQIKGYRTTVKVKTDPKTLEQYLMDPSIMEMTAGLTKIEKVSGQKFQNLGDTAQYEIKVLRFSFRIKAILIYHQTGEEIWYASQGGKAIIIFRFQMKEEPDGTRLTMSCEMLEEGDATFKELAKLINIYDLIAKGFETALAEIQAHFDPALNASELLAKGIRGEFYEAIFTGHIANIFLDRPAEQVMESLKDPEFWSYFEKQTGARISECFYQFEPGPCPIQIGSLDYDLIQGPYNLGKYLFNYYYSGDSRFQLSLRPEGEGTVLTFFYLSPPPDYTSAEILNLALNYNKTREMVARILVLVKDWVEDNHPVGRQG